MRQAKQVEQAYRDLLQAKGSPIKEKSVVLVAVKWAKATNDLALAQGLLKLSTTDALKDVLGYTKDTTFFDWAIVSSYYSIFHATQALLGLKNVKIQSRLHYATLIAFTKHFIVNNHLKEELFLIYEDAEKKARELLDIIEEEKQKRGMFQYHRLSKNNFGPAQESVRNAQVFLEAIQEVLGKHNVI